MKFAVVSDVHVEQHPDWSRLVFSRLAARKDLDFVAFLGDICTSPEDSWERWFKPLQDLIRCPIYACRGNHDNEGRWDKWWGYRTFSSVVKGVKIVLFDSNIDFLYFGRDWLNTQLQGNEKLKFVFTHLPPRIYHWNYGMGLERTLEYIQFLFRHAVTASFYGHMHGFDHVQIAAHHFFLAGGGGGNPHDDFPILHRSNFYLLIQCSEDDFDVTICQQHRDREQERPMSEWINRTDRAIGGVF